jgi:hypothetical protein
MLPREGRGHWIRQGTHFAPFPPGLESDNCCSTVRERGCAGGRRFDLREGQWVYTLHGVFGWEIRKRIEVVDGQSSLWREDDGRLRLA